MGLWLALRALLFIIGGRSMIRDSGELKQEGIAAAL
jgi:hypothetical protein